MPLARILSTTRLPFAIVLLALAASAPAQAQRPDVVYVPTAASTVQQMMEIANVGPHDFVIDLGSGDGRIAIAAAARGARALGVDIDPVRVREAQANAKAMGVASRVTFRRENLFNTALGQATVITLYLLPELNLKLRPRLLGLRPGTRVVSHNFDMGDWKPDATANGPVLLWIVPARAAGRWQVTHGERRIPIVIKQRFQDISGTALVDGRTVALGAARLRGSEIEFAVDLGGQPVQLRGTVEGGRMRGRVGASEWTATRS